MILSLDIECSLKFKLAFEEDKTTEQASHRDSS